MKKITHKKFIKVVINILKAELIIIAVLLALNIALSPIQRKMVSEQACNSTPNISQPQTANTPMSTEITDTSSIQAYTVQRMRIYHYCSCSKCTPGTDITASGKKVAIGMVAMYGIPFGTVIEINGKKYAVEDRGVGVGKVDIYVNSHEEALNLGTYIADVKIYK